MSSINLLPKGVNVKKEAEGGMKICSFVSLLLLLSSIAFAIFTYAGNIKFSKDVEKSNSDLSLVDERLEEEINKNKLSLFENKEWDISLLLSEHSYPTKVINLIQNNITDETYLTNLKIAKNKDLVSVEFNGVVKDYPTFATQLYVFKKMPEAVSIDIKEINEEDLYFSFGGSINFDKSVILY